MNKFKIYIDPDIGYSVTDTNDNFIFATETKDKAKEIVSALEKQIPKKPINISLHIILSHVLSAILI